MTDFWLSCGHHFLDRDEGGGYVVTDDFLKIYLARPELLPPPNACPIERSLLCAHQSRHRVNYRRVDQRPFHGRRLAFERF